MDHDWVGLSPEAVRALAPEAIAAFDVVLGVVGSATDPRLLELTRRRIAMLLQIETSGSAAVATLTATEASELSRWPTSPEFSAADRTCLSFAEQYVLDSSAVTAEDRDSLTQALGPATFGFVQALYVLDHGTRLVAVTRQLFGVEVLRPQTSESDPDLWPALESMMTAVARLGSLDPLTAEPVRLRRARAHHCRLCMSRRRVAAVEMNGDALETADAVERSDLDEPQRVALRLTDGVLVQPGALPADLISATRAALTPAQALEIVLLVAHNAANKIAVALGADQPTVTGDVEYFDIAASGDYSYGLPAPI
jgi:alkylhydroperoxidase family enzyme